MKKKRRRKVSTEQEAVIEQLKTVLTEVTAKLKEQDKILKDLAEPPGMLARLTVSCLVL
jgi:uncharacterized coiled-coil protein SlyX